VVRSAAARQQQLHVSTLERLMGTAAYTRGTVGTRAVITVLRKNYRSHEKLLEFPSARFYGNQLEMCADKAVVDSLLDWDEVWLGTATSCHGYPCLARYFYCRCDSL
jgi:helicase MOV-10